MDTATPEDVTTSLNRLITDNSLKEYADLLPEVPLDHAKAVLLACSLEAAVVLAIEVLIPINTALSGPHDRFAVPLAISEAINAVTHFQELARQASAQVGVNHHTKEATTNANN